MNKRFLAVMLSVLLAFMAFPSIIPAHAVAESTYDWIVPEGYNEHDYNAVASFLEQDSAFGVTNGILLNPNYDVNDPQTWDNGQSGALSCYARWIEVNGENRLWQVKFYYGFAGVIDLSNCDELDLADLSSGLFTSVNCNNCPKLTYLNVGDNQFLSDFSCSECPSIQRLFINRTIVSEIDLSCMTQLQGLYCGESSVSELDLSACVLLEDFECTLSPIHRLDLSNNNQLTGVRCWGCGLEELILPADPSPIRTIWCFSNELTELDVSNCSSLSILYCQENHISKLDVSNSPELAAFQCQNNDLTELDVSNNPLLEQLFCNGNHLTCLDLSSNPIIPINRILSEGNGDIGLGYENVFELVADLYALPNDGETFLGWYNEDGELLSNEAQFDAAGFVGSDAVFIARFTGGAEPLLGDVNGDGTVNSEDALLVMRSTLGLTELTSEQNELADINGDGIVNLVDALLILRTAMGLI